MTGDVRAEDAALRAALVGAREVVPYKDGDDVGAYCGKACKYVTQRVRVSNHNDPKRTLHVFCTTTGCMGHHKVSDLPKRYRVSQQELASIAVRALPALLDRVAAAETERDRLLFEFVQWVATNRAYNGSDHRHGQSLYNECLNSVLHEWAADFLRAALDQPQEAT